MSKMDRKSNQKTDKKSIYEIFTSCRLCGAGGGYKIPIVQNIVDLDAEVELKQKIRECVQIEVHQDDKMPPLICELCIDKTNDFYEFLRMCQETNKSTRIRLGLPESSAMDVSESSDCILGVTEKVYSCESDDDNVPLFSNSKRRVVEKSDGKGSKSADSNKGSVKKNHRAENIPPKNSMKMQRELVGLMQPVVPLKRMARVTDSFSEEETRATRSKKITPEPSPKKSIIKKEIVKEPEHQKKKVKEVESPRPIRKRSIEVETPRPAPAKKVKIATPPPEALCDICNSSFPSLKSVYNHMRSHTVSYTSERLACNCCGEWFSSPTEANTHHKRHKYYYNCEKCDATYTSYNSYKEHFEEKPCSLYEEVPDEKCPVCWKLFPTNTLLQQHRCPGKDGKAGGKCPKCNKHYALMKNLKKHEAACNKSFELKIDPEVKKSLQTVHIKMARCDAVLDETRRGEHYDVSAIIPLYDLDDFSYYPYKYGMRDIKAEYQDSMVNIHYDALDYVHWDSDVSTDAEDSTRPKVVEKLSTIALKVIYSKKFLGKMPRKRKKFFRTEDLINRYGDGKLSMESIDRAFKDWDDDANSDVRDVNTDISKIVDSLGRDSDGAEGNDSPNIFSSLKSSGDVSVGNVFGDVDIDASDKADNVSTNDSLKSHEADNVANNDKNNSDENNDKNNSDVVNDSLASISENKDSVMVKNDDNVNTRDVKEQKETTNFSISSIIDNNEPDKLNDNDNLSSSTISASQSSSKVDNNCEGSNNDDDKKLENTNNSDDNSSTKYNGNENNVNDKDDNEKSVLKNNEADSMSDKELMKAIDEQIGES